MKVIRINLKLQHVEILWEHVYYTCRSTEEKFLFSNLLGYYYKN